MIVTSPDGPYTVRATFRLQQVVDCHEICLVGEFNDWSPTANPMTSNGYGYIAEIVIRTGRTYRFRYLIDNERWQNDWAADSYEPNEFGGDDSVLDLTKPRASLLGSN
jgi:1,4-alpha-glucan branching enzyme